MSRFVAIVLTVTSAVSITKADVPVTADQLIPQSAAGGWVVWEFLAVGETPDGELLALSLEPGAVFRVIDGVADVPPLLRIVDAPATGEAGVLGLAIDPAFAKNRDFYIFYTGRPAGQLSSVVSRFHYADGVDQIDRNSEEVVLRLPQESTAHNGGWIGFGPDGFLYVATGDDNALGSALSHDLRGKILRIDPSHDDYPDDPDRNYAIPTQNPFANSLEGDPAVLAMGLRNPWRCGFDTLTGDLWIGDVGSSYFEEINLIPVGTGAQNFGWPSWEGDLRLRKHAEHNGFTFPVHQRRHHAGESEVIIGGAIYRGAAIPELYGAYLFGNYSTSEAFALVGEKGSLRVQDLTSSLGLQRGRTGELFGFSLTRDGEILICYRRGIWQIVPDNCLRRVGALLAHYGGDEATDPEFPFDLDDNEDGQINLADLAATLSTAPCGG